MARRHVTISMTCRPPARPARPVPPIRPSVIIVGAGFAGLAAACDLHARGFHVRLVDARPRIGGRVHTIRDGFVDGQHGEAGGELIDRDHTAAIELAHSLGPRLTRILRKGFGSHLVGPGGRVRHRVSQTTDWKRLANAFRRARSTTTSARRRPALVGRRGRARARRAFTGTTSRSRSARAGRGASAKEVAWLCTQWRASTASSLPDGNELSDADAARRTDGRRDPGRARVPHRRRQRSPRRRRWPGRSRRMRSCCEREVVAITQTESGVRVSLRDGELEAGYVDRHRAGHRRAPHPLRSGAAGGTASRDRHAVGTAMRPRRCCSARIRSGALPIGPRLRHEPRRRRSRGTARKDSQAAPPSSCRWPADRRARRRRSCCARKDRKDFLDRAAARRSAGRRA